MSSLSSSFIRGKFAEYYQKYSSSIQPPAALEKREFGFVLLKERIMLRHKSFDNGNALRSFLETTVPSDVYYSSAYYESPEREMEQKGWLGADLIFDIDADHIPTPCGKDHDTWVCSNCGATGRGASPEECPLCSKQKFDEKTWPCEVCLETAKAEAMKLIDFLTKDFGFSQEELKAAFSGHRGYHVHVESEEIQMLDSMDRKEIVDYVLGTGLETEFHGLEEIGSWGEPPVLVGPDLSDLGWNGRIARGTYDFLVTATPEEMKKIGLNKKVVDLIGKHKDTLLESWKEKTPWAIIKDIGKESWRKIAEHGVKNQSAKIDTVVTTDTHRLIRLADTLHGKTGLKKMEVPITGIEGFDPLKSAVTFKEGTLTVDKADAPQFRLEEESYGPFSDERVELPTAAALFLLCKGAAEVVR